MEKIGIIVEYNPFHNGHLYHLNEIKKKFPKSLIIAVMSGNFTQRGDLSVLDKYEKTKIALEYGVDIVVSLPFIFATQNADVFASAAISILQEFQVDILVFGSESNDIEKLIMLAKKQLNNQEYSHHMKKLLKTGISYPKALSEALENKSETLYPNDLLGMTYIKSILQQNSTITPVTIQRTNHFHSHTLEGNIASATAIRQGLEKQQDITAFIPSLVKHHLEKTKNSSQDILPFLQYKILSEKNDIAKYATVDEGIENRIIEKVNDVSSIDEFILKVKSKRYTYNKISRMFAHILCSLTKEEIKKNPTPSYLQVLGCSKKGQAYLHDRKKNFTLPLITNPKYFRLQLAIEKRADEVYYLITGKRPPKEPFLKK